MASAAQNPSSAQTWHYAKSLRVKVADATKAIDTAPGGQQVEATLRDMEDHLSRYREAIIAIVLQDFQYATGHKADLALWTMTAAVNNTFRGLSSHLKDSEQIVAHRKIDKSYHAFLRTSVMFYKAYFQRLWALSGMPPQLARIGRALQLEPIPVSEISQSPVDQAQVLGMCQNTLLRLGDLSRYRHQARQSEHSPTTTLAYYSLAHEFDPTSGLALHQIGMIHVGHKDTLAVAYYFYRSLATQHPHPNAAHNLDVEFKRCLKHGAAATSTGVIDPVQVLSSWFTRLHAYFAIGSRFSQHEELEQEVLRQFKTLLGSAANLTVLTTSLRMVTINIAAYQVARSRAEITGTETKIRSRQYALQINIRTAALLTKQLCLELPNYDEKATLSGNSGTPTPPSVFSNVLTLARLYLAWIYACKNDIVANHTELGPYIYDLYQCLAEVLNAVKDKFLGRSMKPCPYLLPEDVDLLGLKPLDDVGIDSSGRLLYAIDATVAKPQIEDAVYTRGNPKSEALNRVYDFLSCGFSLVNDPVFPLGTTTIMMGSFETITVVVTEAGGSSQDTRPLQSSHLMLQAGHSGEALPAETRLDVLPAERPFSSATLAGRGCEHHQPQEVLHPPFGSEELGMDDQSGSIADLEMERRFDEFLAPPLSKPEQADTHTPRRRRESDYSTDENVDGPRALWSTTTTTTDSQTKPFPTLPWDYFAPTPRQAVTAGTRRPSTDTMSFSVSSSDSPMAAVQRNDGGASGRFGSWSLGEWASAADTSSYMRGSPMYSALVDAPRQAMYSNRLGYADYDSRGTTNIPGPSSLSLYTIPPAEGQFIGTPVIPQHVKFGPGPAKAVCNGNTYDATTAFGRGVIATKDDPNHYKNVMQHTHVGRALGEAEAFDRATLLSALDSPTRPK